MKKFVKPIAVVTTIMLVTSGTTSLANAKTYNVDTKSFKFLVKY